MTFVHSKYLKDLRCFGVTSLRTHSYIVILRSVYSGVGSNSTSGYKRSLEKRKKILLVEWNFLFPSLILTKPKRILRGLCCSKIFTKRIITSRVDSRWNILITPLNIGLDLSIEILILKILYFECRINKNANVYWKI